MAGIRLKGTCSSAVPAAEPSSQIKAVPSSVPFGFRFGCARTRPRPQPFGGAFVVACIAKIDRLFGIVCFGGFGGIAFAGHFGSGSTKTVLSDGHN